MFKAWKKGFCGALAAALLFTGCGSPAASGSGGTGGGAAMGRFVEEKLELPGGAVLQQPVLCQGKEGALTVLDLGEEPRRWDSPDQGESWAETPIPWAAGELEQPYYADCAPDGTIWATTREGGLFKVSPEGEVQRVPVGVIDEALAQGLRAHLEPIALSADRVYLDYSLFEISEGAASSAGGGSALLDGQGNLVADFGANIYHAARTGDTLYLYDTMNNCQKVDAATGASLETMEGRGLFPDEVSAMAALGGTIYMQSAAGLSSVIFGGSLAQIRLEATEFAFGDPTASLLGLVPLGEECFVMLLDDGSGAALYRYRFDPAIPTQASVALQVWSLEEHEMLRLAVRQFRRAHPEMDVTLEIALPEGSTQTTEDAVRTLNTELLNGQGPDVLILDGLPVESLAENGMLADLGALVDPAALQPAFVKPFQQGQNLYMLPAQFALPVLAGSAGQLAQAATLEQLAQMITDGPALWDPEENGGNPFQKLPAEERPVLYFDDLRALFDTLWAASAPAVLGADGRVDEAAFRRFAGAMAAIDGRYQLAAKGQAAGGVMGGGLSNITYTFNSDWYNYRTGGAQMASARIDNLFMLAYAMMGGPEGQPGGIALFPGVAEGCYLPQLLAGVNSAGSHQAEAGVFVQSLFSAEVQGTLLERGLPTTKAGLAKQLAALEEQLKEVERQDSLYDPTPLLEQLAQPVLTPSAVTEAAFEAVRALCLGEADLDGAAAQFQKAVGLYLAEQR